MAENSTEITPGKGDYRVIGSVAVVRTIGRSEQYVYRGGRFDGASADAASIEHLLEVGLLEKITEPRTVSPAAERALAEAAAKAKADAAAEQARVDAVAAAKAKADAAAEQARVDAEAAAKAKAEQAAAAAKAKASAK